MTATTKQKVADALLETYQKNNKSEWWAYLVAVLTVLLAPKLGVPEESMSALIMSVFGSATAFAAQRGWVKSKAGKV